MTKRNNKRTARRALSLLLALVMLIGVLPQITLPTRADWRDDWEWGDEDGVAIASCPECGMEYQVEDVHSSSEAESALEEYFCDGCGLCSGEANMDCWVEHHCEGCGSCVDDADICDGCKENDLIICENCIGLYDLAGVHCPFCKQHFGAGVLECDCEYTIVTPHCDECHEESCVNCGVCLVLCGDETEFLTNGGCADHGLCVACIQYDPDHCKECWTCDSDICFDCGYCEDCAKNHCPECGTCFGEDDVEWCAEDGEHCVFCCMDNNWLCEECGQCMEALGLERCDDCGLCEECCESTSENEGCTHGYCIVSSDYEEHLCPGCMTCPDDMECEYCGMCESCQEDYHCEHGFCPEGPDFDDHVCENCGNCFEIDELCEFCRMCEDCREDYHCRHDICPDDPMADADHAICAQCYTCFEDAELCPDCGLCESCCAQNTLAVGCEHGYCIESDAFLDHWCYADGQCADKCDHNTACAHANVSTTWSSGSSAHWHVCEDCGASLDEDAHTPGELVTVTQPDPLTRKNGTGRISCTVCGVTIETVSIPYVEIPADGKPYILSEPKDCDCKVSDVTMVGVTRYASFKVVAGGSELSYQWYKRRGGGPAVKVTDGGDTFTDNSGKPDVVGATTSALTVAVDPDACYENVCYYCVINNGNGSVTTREAKVNAEHVFGCYSDNFNGTHTNYCLGDGCDAVKGKPTAHRYGEWTIKQAATATQQGIREQKCMFCPARNTQYIPKVEPDHVHKFDRVRNSPTKHWFECACGLKSDEPMTDHTWGEPTVTVQPTEKSVGEQVYACTVCGYKKKETLNRLPHTHEFWDPAQVGYTDHSKTGYNSAQHYAYCKSGDGQIKGEKHTFGDWSIDRTATATEKGRIKRKCKRCPYTEYYTYTKPTAHLITVKGGTADPPIAVPGDHVKVTLELAPGYYWPTGSVWKDLSSELADQGYKPVAITPSEHSDTIIFRMPDGPVALEAVGVTLCPHNGAKEKGERVEPTCTGYGHEPDTLCSYCGTVLEEGARIEAPGHDLPAKPIAGTERKEYCTIAAFEGGKLIGVPNTETGGYSGNFICNRCNQVVKGKKTPLVHGRHDKNKIYSSGSGMVWEGGEYTYVVNRVEPTCTTDGYTGDEYCSWCEKRIWKGEKEPRCGHAWDPWETVREATTRVKGIEQRVCRLDHSHVETRVTDYSGPDYRVRADKSKIYFDFTYGEQPDPVEVRFTSIGRNQVHAITNVNECVGRDTTQKLDGMTMTVSAVPWELIDSDPKEHEVIQITDVDGIALPEQDVVEIEVIANIHKTTNKYDLTVEDGKACIDGKDKKTAQASLSVPGGEHMRLMADNLESFARWEIVEDESGYISSLWSYWDDHFKESETDFYMSPNRVKFRALSKDTPGVCRITFDPNGGVAEYKESYTNSKGKIDVLPTAWRSNYIFEGWWTEAEGGTQVELGAELSRDTTLYAHWREKLAGQYKITFEPNGGTVDTPSALTVDGELFSMPKATHPHLYFEGWYTAPVGGSHVPGWTVFTADTVLYAHWEYGLKIDGVTVTDENREDILGDGRFSFDGVSTLTVNGSYRTGRIENVIYNNGFKGLVIKVAQDVSLISTSKANPIMLETDTTITGPGKLKVSGGISGIYMAPKAGTLTIKDINVEASGQWGVAGQSGENTAKLVLDNAGLQVNSREAAICDFGGGITMKDCWIVQPEDGKISDDGTDVVEADGTEAKAVIIEAARPIETFLFDDVQDESKFYFMPVYWAYGAKPQITNGIDATHFGPDRTCTRGQVVTFLWRAKGCPEPTKTDNPFTDVKEGAFYYKAVLWAVENGITNGMDPTHFGPDLGCTRGQVVTFLWRTEHEPKPASTDNPFVDVKSDKFYFNAVLWAVSHKPQITNGTDATHFSPNATCTRGQIVAFLYRDLA